MKAVKLGLWAAITISLLILFVSLIGQNQELMTVSLFRHTSDEYPKWAVLIACGFIGAILSALFFIVELIVFETKNIRLRRLNAKLERALAASGVKVPGHTPASHASNGSSPVGPSISSEIEEDV